MSRPDDNASRPDSAHHRKNWQAIGKTQLLSALENKTLAPATLFVSDPSTSPGKGTTIVLPKSKNQPQVSKIGETIVLPKKQLSDVDQGDLKKDYGRIGETIVLSSARKDPVGKMDEKERPASSPESKSEIGRNLSEKELESKTEGEKGLNNIEGTGVKVKETVEDDSDIEELTAVSETISGTEKPRARAAWSSNGMWKITESIDKLCRS